MIKAISKKTIASLLLTTSLISPISHSARTYTVNFDLSTLEGSFKFIAEQNGHEIENKNYLERVTLRMNAILTAEEMYSLFEGLLNANGYKITTKNEKLLIEQDKNTPQNIHNAVLDVKNNHDFTLENIALKEATIEEASEELDKLLIHYGYVYTYEQPKTITIIDTQENIARAKAALNKIPSGIDLHFDYFPTKFSDIVQFTVEEYERNSYRLNTRAGDDYNKFESTGLKEDDVIIAINDIYADSQSQIRSIYDKVRESDQIEILVSREGHDEYIRFNISQ